MKGIIFWVLKTVHCRTGSLEKKFLESITPLVVHCRTGSLEKYQSRNPQDVLVHCRTGSLESKARREAMGG